MYFAGRFFPLESYSFLENLTKLIYFELKCKATQRQTVSFIEHLNPEDETLHEIVLDIVVSA